MRIHTCLCACVCMSLCVRMHVYAHACMQVCVCACMSVCICMSECVYVCTSVCMCVCGVSAESSFGYVAPRLTRTLSALASAPLRLKLRCEPPGLLSLLLSFPPNSTVIMTCGRVALSRLTHCPPGKVADLPCNLLNIASKKEWRSHVCGHQSVGEMKAGGL